MAGDWQCWHDAYSDPESSLSRRLAHVQRRVGAALDAAAPGPIRALSMCAGQGRDLLEPLAGHPRRHDVQAVLVELDAANAEVARRTAAAAGLAGVRVVVGDASITSGYAQVVPVDLALVCGVFGNISDADVRGTVRALPGLVRTGGTVIWTRHRGEPDLTPAIRDWFADEGFAELGWDVEDGFRYAVGSHRLAGPVRHLGPGGRLFRFLGDGSSAVR